MLNATKDNVPNVRLVATKILNNVFQNLGQAEQASVKSGITALSNDQDKDVKEFAKVFFATQGA